MAGPTSVACQVHSLQSRYCHQGPWGKVWVGWHRFCSLMLVHAVTFLGSFSYPGFLCLKVLCFHMLGASVGQPPVPQCLTATQRLLKAHTSGGDASHTTLSGNLRQRCEGWHGKQNFTWTQTVVRHKIPRQKLRNKQHSENVPGYIVRYTMNSGRPFSGNHELAGG